MGGEKPTSQSLEGRGREIKGPDVDSVCNIICLLILPPLNSATTTTEHCFTSTHSSHSTLCHRHDLYPPQRPVLPRVSRAISHVNIDITPLS